MSFIHICKAVGNLCAKMSTRKVALRKDLKPIRTERTECRARRTDPTPVQLNQQSVSPGFSRDAPPNVLDSFAINTEAHLQ